MNDNYLGKLTMWDHVNLRRFHDAKCKVLNLGWNNPQYQSKLEDEGMESRRT